MNIHVTSCKLFDKPNVHIRFYDNDSNIMIVLTAQQALELVEKIQEKL